MVSLISLWIDQEPMDEKVLPPPLHMLAGRKGTQCKNLYVQKWWLSLTNDHLYAKPFIAAIQLSDHKVPLDYRYI